MKVLERKRCKDETFHSNLAARFGNASSILTDAHSLPTALEEMEHIIYFASGVTKTHSDRVKWHLPYLSRKFQLEQNNGAGATISADQKDH
jgi:hypothetical protein